MIFLKKVKMTFLFWAVILDLEDLFNKRTEMEDVPEVNLTTVPFYVR